MKKALIFLLTLAVVGAVFAQDNPTLKLSGSIQTGLEYYMGDNQDDPNVVSYADDAGVPGYRLRLVGDYVNGVTAVHFRISSTANADYDPVNTVVTDFVWADLNLLDNVVLIQAGYNVDDNAWRTKGDEEMDYDVKGGVKVHFKPIAGLDAGFAFGVPNTDAPGVKPEDATYVLGLAYTADMYSFQAGAKFDGGDAKAIYGGAEYTGVENLVLDLEAEMKVADTLLDGVTPASLSDYSDVGRTEVVQSVEYTKDALGAGVYAYEFLYGNSDVDMGLKIAPYVSYTTGITTLKLEVAYNNDEGTISDDWEDWVDPTKADFSILSVKPTATFQFNDKSKVVTGYEYVAFTDMAADNAQKLFVNFRYDF